MQTLLLAACIIVGLVYILLKALQKQTEVRHIKAITRLLSAQNRRALRVLPAIKLLSSQWLRERSNPKGAFRYEALYEDEMHEQYLVVYRVNFAGHVSAEWEDEAPSWSRGTQTGTAR